MHIARSKATLFYISILILIIPTILSAAHPVAAAAAAGAGLSSRALAQEGEFKQTAVGGKRRVAQPQDGGPAAKKQKAEDISKEAQEETFEEFEARVGMKNAEAFTCNATKARTPAEAQTFADAENVLHLYRNPALVLSCRSSNHSADLVQWYIDHGSLVNGDGFAGENPLLRYIQCSPNSNSPGHPKVRILLQEGALLYPYTNNILQRIKELEKSNKDNKALLIALQEIRLLLKQHSEYRHTGIYQDLVACTMPTSARFPRELQKLIVHYYLSANAIQEPTYEELEKEPTESQKALARAEKELADLKKDSKGAPL